MDVMQMLEMVLHVDKTLGIVIEQYGVLVYWILSAIVFGETGLVVLPFLPGDTLLFIGGAFCATGAMDPWLLMGMLIVAAIAGNTLNYWIGSLIGQKVFTHNYRWLDQQALRKTHTFYDKHGGKTILLSRFIPIVRTFAPFVAGVSGMPFRRFQFYNVSGALAWVISLVGGGYFFGNIPGVREHLNTIVLIGVGAAILPLLVGGLWRTVWRLTHRTPNP
jgi:membrane-associated protein